MKLAVVTPIPTPYRDPFWNEVAEQGRIELTVFYCAAGKSDRPWSGDWERKYAWEVLPGKNLLYWKESGASMYDNPGIIKHLASGGFDAVLVGGYNHLTMLRAMRWCIRHEVPYFLMCESHLESPRSKLKLLAKNRLIQWVVRNMAGGFPTGTLAERYLVHHGADRQTLYHLPNAPDVEGIRHEAEAWRAKRVALREELGFSKRPTLLFVGRLIHKKGVQIAISAIASLKADDRPDLVIIGDGPERQELAQLAEGLGVSEWVRFTGFVEPANMVRWYVASDLFVLPSVETWGVVVSEALAAGVPVLVSDQVGCHLDIVREGVCGRVVRRNDVSAWTSAIQERLSGACMADQVELHWQPVFEQLRYSNLAKGMASFLPGATEVATAHEVVSAR